MKEVAKIFSVEYNIVIQAKVWKPKAYVRLFLNIFLNINSY